MAGNELFVLYGTETGNSEATAKLIKESAERNSMAVTFQSLANTKVSDLANMKFMILVTSTWGDGEPPGGAVEFCETLYEAKEPNLSGMLYSVVALGDTSYEDFCGCGRRVDEALTRLGAKSFAPRKELDTDFEETFEPWLDGITKVFASA